TPHLITGRATEHQRIAMIFSGQGTQQPHMGHELYHTYPAYADAFDTACTALDPHLPHPLHDIIFPNQNTDPQLIHQTQYAQPALFALHTALYRLWESWGIHPTTLTGHSIGEISAAHLAGILTLNDAATLITTRARLMQTLPTNGTMTAINITEQQLQPLLQPHTHTASIAAINNPNNLVISGDTTTINTITQQAQQQGHRTKQLNVSHAFHSPLIQPILKELHTTLQQLTYHPPTIPIISTQTGQPATHHMQTPEYWTQHARNTVRFADAITTLTHQHHTTYLEIGPTTTLTPHLPPNTHPTLNNKQPETTTITTTLAHLTTQGTNPNWNTYYQHTNPHTTPLPTYPFQHHHYW
ncbi:acyltransferase domain-containing protein, partial [Streptomyces sp. NPDC002044]|uniref:acyltransferase domain-containing protein n=1 Tax=Streptomyces sp. NPDC002044 TaxID=3154662 RepID=UPI00332F3608